MGPLCTWNDHPQISHYDHDTFEKASDQWGARNYGSPKVSGNGGAYCGARAQHHANADGVHGGSWGRNFEGARAPWDTDKHNYMCMATRIPAGTTLNMLVHVKNGDGRNGGWKTVEMNLCYGAGCASYKTIASWNLDVNGNAKPLQADGEWHYRCINLDEQLDASLGHSSHTISAVIFHAGNYGGMPRGEFWIDEFSISSHPRSPARVIDVPRAAVGVFETGGRAPFVAAAAAAAGSADSGGGGGNVAVSAMLVGARVALRGRFGVYVSCPAYAGAAGTRCETSEEPQYFTVAAAKRGGYGDGGGGAEGGRVELRTPHGTLLALSIDRKTAVQIDGAGDGEGATAADFARRAGAQLRLVRNVDGTVFLQSRDLSWLTCKEKPGLAVYGPKAGFDAKWTEQRFSLEPEPLQCRAPMRALIGGVGGVLSGGGLPDSALSASSEHSAPYVARHGRFGSHDAWIAKSVDVRRRRRSAAPTTKAWFQADVGAGTAAGATVHEVWVSGRGCCGNDYIKTFTLSYKRHGAGASAAWEEYTVAGFPAVAASASNGNGNGGGGSVHLVHGAYEYYHYLQEKKDDKGWGCAYRSLQSVVSWYVLTAQLHAQLHARCRAS